MSQQGLEGLPEHVTTKDLAQLFDLGERRVQQLTNEDAFHRVGRGKYDLKQSIAKYMFYKINEAMATVSRVVDDDGEEIDNSIEQALWTRARREKTELEVAIIKGELHRSEDVRAITSDMLSAFRSRLMSLPSKVAPLVLPMDDLKEIEAVVKDNVHVALNEMKEYDPAEYYARSSDVMFLTEEELEGGKRNGPK